MLNRLEVTVDIAREYNLDFSYLEDYEHSGVKSYKTVSVADIVKA